MRHLRWRAILLGAAAFLSAHAIERAMWTRWFADEQAWTPWFTNSGRAVLLTMACVAVAGVVAGVLSRSRRALVPSGANVSGGGILALIFALFVSDAGTIAPVVAIIGGAVVIAAAYAGTAVSALIVTR